MDADIPESLLQEIQAIIDIEGEEFLNFVREIIASSPREIRTIDDLRNAMAEYLADRVKTDTDQEH